MNNIEYNLSKDLQNRLNEFTFINDNILNYLWQEWEKTSIRSGLVMIYSNWEWFCKNSTELTFKELKKLNIPISEVNIWFIKNNFIDNKINISLSIKAIASKYIFWNKIYLHDIPVKFDTWSNLFYSTFKNNFLKKLCISTKILEKKFEINLLSSTTFPSEYFLSWKLSKILVLKNGNIEEILFESYDKFFEEIIKLLLHLRNWIAHWTIDITLTSTQFKFIFETLKILLISYKDTLLTYIEQEYYK